MEVLDLQEDLLASAGLPGDAEQRPWPFFELLLADGRDRAAPVAEHVPALTALLLAAELKLPVDYHALPGPFPGVQEDILYSRERR